MSTARGRLPRVVHICTGCRAFLDVVRHNADNLIAAKGWRVAGRAAYCPRCAPPAPASGLTRATS